MITINKIYNYIRNSIISGRFQDGEFIRQDALASTLSTSKIPIRESLMALSIKGYLEYIPDRGMRVRKVKPHEFQEFYAIRKPLELVGFKYSWKYHIGSLYNRLEYLLCQIDNLINPSDINQLYWMFHHLLIKDSKMNHLTESLDVYHFLCNQINYYITDIDFIKMQHSYHYDLLENMRKQNFKISFSILSELLTFPRQFKNILANMASTKFKKNKIEFQIYQGTNMDNKSNLKVNNKTATRKTKGSKWKFWIDRGGTFTDVVAMSPNKKIQVKKLLSNNPKQYQDAAVEAIREFLELKKFQKIDPKHIDSVKMGTTVATNALLERKGEPTALFISNGLKDAIRIGYQNRPKLFDLEIILPELLYKEVVEVEERIDVNGKVLIPLNTEKVKQDLKQVYRQGYRALAVVLMHSYKFPQHEKQIEKIAQQIGFTQVSVSSQISSLIKIISRGDTTIADAYLNPILQNYVKTISSQIGNNRLFFMQSNSGLTSAKTFRGKDAILSGPAGGIVGMVKTAEMGNIHKIIGFDMGGTSTDVSHYNGEYERLFETTISGVRICAPMMNISTVAAGGGSILHYNGQRFLVGPDSAGANPGPACYRGGGPLTVTDCNVMLGNIDPQYFPKVFGPKGNQPIDTDIVKKQFQKIAQTTGKSPEEVAEGFLKIAVENMANAIKKISIQKGYDITKYVLYCFGGAGGQHACAVAESLGMDKILIHPLSSVLSAYGMGLADTIEIKSKSVEQEFSKNTVSNLKPAFLELELQGIQSLKKQGKANEEIVKKRKVHLRYAGTNTEFPVRFASYQKMTDEFINAHKQRFGFVMKMRDLMVGTISVELTVEGEKIIEPTHTIGGDLPLPKPIFSKDVYIDQQYQNLHYYNREELLPGHFINGPAVIIEENSTVLLRPNWQAEITSKNHLLMTQSVANKFFAIKTSKTADPILLEIFNNLFMSIAEQMGEVLANVAYSVNIKERMDFSCALFDSKANLIANAPHIPVHLGSMGDSVRSVIQKWDKNIKPGDTFILNDPYDGGTHLPDITLVTPVFIEGKITFYVASRGHHADIGGIAPGSMPATSKHIDEEGVLIANFKLVEKWQWMEDRIKKCLTEAKHPVRNYQQNIEDLKAQLAANEKGVMECIKCVKQFGVRTTLDYVNYVQDAAEKEVGAVLANLKSNSFEHKMDHGGVIKVSIKVDNAQQKAVIDFTGTSSQAENNFNAPLAVCKAAVLYVIRTLVKKNIPMNEGCLRAIKIIVPKKSFINSSYPAAIVAGNVETSQGIVDAIYGAIGIMGESQGTMNNFTFGNEQYQYYETICGGTGAGDGFNGCDAVHSNMTNSLMTDPEILELRYPVLLKQFKIRKGSGGAGKFSGGCGVIREIEFHEKMLGSILSSNRIYSPFGMKGGEPGKPGINKIIRKNGNSEILKPCEEFTLNKDDRFYIETPGGGGFGKKSNK